jgi:hypothetical protein
MISVLPRSRLARKCVQRTGVDGVEELVALLRLADVGVDEERVDFRVDVLPAGPEERTGQLAVSGGSFARLVAERTS